MNKKLIRSLRVFVKTAQTLSMSQTAKCLDMSTSAVSQHISRLEEDIGVTLLNRSTRRLMLSEAGEVYLESARELLRTIERVQFELEKLSSSPSGRLKIAAPVGFGGGLLSRPLQQLIDEFSDIELSITLTDDPLDLVAAGIDLAICVGPLEDTSLLAQHLVDWQLIPCVSANHPLAAENVTAPEALDGYEYIGHLRTHSADLTLTHSLSKEQKGIKKPRITVNNMQALIQLVYDGLGFGFLPEPEVRSAIERGDLVHILPQWQVFNYPVYAVTAHSSDVPVKTKVAIELIKLWFEAISDGLNVNPLYNKAGPKSWFKG